MKNKTKEIGEQNIDPKNIEDLDFENARTVFMIRARMLEVKENYKKKYGNNLICEMCHQQNENQHTCLIVWHIETL